MMKILIVEDEEAVQARYKRDLPEFTLIQSTTVSGGRELFGEHKSSLDAIVLDGDICGEGGWNLAQEFREAGFTGVMVAASHSSTFQGYLTKAGCNHRIRWKKEVPELLKRLLL